MTPKVSIVIPIYNAERFLEETITSVLNQSYQDFELLLVNDGSTDRSPEICKSFADSRISYLEIPNGGVSNARNVGYEKSKGEYLAFLDADDVWLPERLGMTVHQLEKDLACGLVHTHVQVIDADSNKLDTIYRGKEGNILDDLLKWEECCIPAPSSVLIRRSVLEDVGLFDINLSTAADHDIFFRIANSYPIGMVSEVLGLYRVHGENMHLNIRRMEKEHVYTYKKAFENRFFKSQQFKRYCFGSLYRVLSGSYWKNANDPLNAVRCGLISLYYNPSPKSFLRR